MRSKIIKPWDMSLIEKNNKYMFKNYYEKGHRCSLQYQKKIETIFIVSEI